MALILLDRRNEVLDGTPAQRPCDRHESDAWFYFTRDPVFAPLRDEPRFRRSPPDATRRRGRTSSLRRDERRDGELTPALHRYRPRVLRDGARLPHRAASFAAFPAFASVRARKLHGSSNLPLSGASLVSASVSIPVGDVLIEDERTALSKEALKRAFLDNLFYIQGKFPALATRNDYYMALAYTVRDRMLQRWISTAAAYTKQGSRTVAYLSAEFLMGPHLGNNLLNLGIYDEVRQAMAELGLDFDELLAQEDEPASATAASAGSPRASSIRWRRSRFPRSATASATSSASSTRRSSTAGRSSAPTSGCATATRGRSRGRSGRVEVKLGGHTEHYQRRAAAACACAGSRSKIVIGVPYDTPILGYRQQHRQHAAAVDAPRRPSRSTSPSSTRRLLRRGQAEGRLREPDQGALSERRADPGQGAAPRAAVLLRLVLAAGHAAHHARHRRFRSSASTRSSPSSSTTRIRRSRSPS